MELQNQLDSIKSSPEIIASEPKDDHFNKEQDMGSKK